MTDKVQKIRKGIERLKSQLIKGACASQIAMETRCKEEAYNEVLAILDSLQVSDISDDLEKISIEADKERKLEPYCTTGNDYIDGYKDGAEWQKEHLWKPADGDDLPIIDREVIALLDNGKVVFAHRPPEYWDGKDIVTGKVTRNYPKTYDKGGWNIPDVKYWLDVELLK